jgi:hypothetical protein
MEKNAVSYTDLLNTFNALQATGQLGYARGRKTYHETITSPTYNTMRDFRTAKGLEGKGAKMAPGVYMGSRIVRGAPMGRHQFIVMIPENPAAVPKELLKDLGNGNYGVIAGAYNTYTSDGTRYLKYVPNHSSDISAARSYFTGKGDIKWLPEIVPTKLTDSIDSTIGNILTKGSNYAKNEAVSPMKYPPLLQNAAGYGINSNTFAQNLLEGAGATQSSKLSGYGPGSRLSLDNRMFNAMAPEEVTALKNPINAPKKSTSTLTKVLKMFKKADEMDKKAVDYSKLVAPALLGTAYAAPAVGGYLAARDTRSAFSKQNIGQKLPPGVYMGARKLRGPIPLGRHQFIVLIPENPKDFPKGQVKDLGGGNKGIVVGAYSRDSILSSDNKLRYSRNDVSDLRAARSYFQGDADTWKTEIIPTQLTHDTDTTIKDILNKGMAYRMNERYRKGVAYPNLFANVTGKGINSNSFAQTLARSAGVKPQGEFAKYSPGQEFTIGADMFAPRDQNIEQRAEQIYEINPDNPEQIIGSMPDDIPAVPTDTPEDKMSKNARQLLLQKLSDCGKREAMVGGLADGADIKSFSAAAMKKGVEVEKEHTSSDAIAAEIAMDHLAEDPEYYDKLEKIHKEAFTKAPAISADAPYGKSGEGITWGTTPIADWDAAEQTLSPEEYSAAEKIWLDDQTRRMTYIAHEAKDKEEYDRLLDERQNQLDELADQALLAKYPNFPVRPYDERQMFIRGDLYKNIHKEAFLMGYMSKESGVVGDVAWELSKIIPFYGVIPSGYDTIKHLGKGQFGSAALDALGTGLALIPDPASAGLQATVSTVRAAKLLNAANKARKASKMKKAWDKVRSIDQKARQILPTAKPLTKLTEMTGRGATRALGGNTAFAQTRAGKYLLPTDPTAVYNRGKNVLDAAWWAGQSVEALKGAGEQRRKQAIMEALQRQGAM